MVDAVWEAAIAGYLTRLAAEGAAQGTLRQRRHYLRRLADLHPGVSPWALTLDDLAAYLAAPSWGAEARKCARSAVRGLYAWAVDTDRIEHSPARHLRPVRVPPGQPRPTPDTVLARALRRAETPEQRAMLMLAAFAGLRRAEIAQVRHDDVIGDELRVRGKGGRVRMVHLHPILCDIVGGGTGYLLPGRRRGTHVTPGHVGKALSRLLGDGWTAHTLRHRFASAAYEVERDIRAVQELLGHSSVRTTMIYTAVPNGAKRRAVAGAVPDHLIAA